MKKLTMILGMILLPCCLYTFQFRYINSPECVTYVTNLLAKSGVSTSNLEYWTAFLNEYNRKVDPHYLEKTIWTASKTNWLDFADMTAYKKIEISLRDKSNNHVTPDDYKYNCLASCFLLTRDMLKVERLQKPFINKKWGLFHLFQYDDSRDNHFDGRIAWLREHGVSLSDHEEQAFRAMDYPAEMRGLSKGPEMFPAAAEKLHEWWRKEGFSFPETLEILQIWAFKLPFQVVFCDHNAVMIENNGRLVVIEKQSFFHPLSVAVFRDYEELGRYINHFYCENHNDGMMITANGKIIWSAIY